MANRLANERMVPNTRKESGYLWKHEEDQLHVLPTAIYITKSFHTKRFFDNIFQNACKIKHYERIIQ